MRRPSPDRWVLAAWVASAVPLLIAGARAAVRDWRPLGDDALVAIRAADVLTVHHPWLGTWSSASLEAGVDLNHPGPLLFDAVALPVRLFGGATGVVVGVVALNLLATATVALFAHRRAGRAAAMTVLLGAAVLAYVMGSELLYDPWNPHVLLLPCLALTVVAWGVADGDRWALPVYLAIGSFCLQTHLGYAYLVPGLLVVAVVVGFAVRRWLGGRGPHRLSRRDAAVAAAVVLLLWWQPLWEQAFGVGEGNLSRILGARDTAGPKAGAAMALRLTASVLTRAPWGWRSGFLDAVPFTPYRSPGDLGPVAVVGTAAALVRLLVLSVLLAAVARSAVRRRDTALLSLVGVAAGGALVALVSITIMPYGPIGLTPHQIRWLWPLWVLVLATLALGAWRAALAREGVRGRLPGVARRAALAAVALVAAATLPTHLQAAGPQATEHLLPLLRSLDRQLGALEGIGTVRIDTSNTPLFDSYSAAVMEELQRRGVPFTVTEPGLVRQLGDRRRDRGHADVVLRLQYGRDALDVVAGADRVAVAWSIGEADARELEALHARVSAGEVLDDAAQARYDRLLAAADDGSIAAVILPGP